MPDRNAVRCIDENGARKVNVINRVRQTENWIMIIMLLSLDERT